jgi:hypothetical protein
MKSGRVRATENSLQVTQLIFAAKMDRIHSILATIFSNIHPQPEIAHLQLINVHFRGLIHGIRFSELRERQKLK